MSKDIIIVGTRKSQLALTQTNQVIALLKERSPQYDFEVKTISTAGDQVLDAPALFSHQGIFVKELEEALKRREIDLAVHSLKDMPCDLPEGLELGALLERVDPRDALITRDGTGFKNLPAGSTIGTSSIRRRAQILFARKDLKVADMRGNVDTRLRKLKEGLVDALIIAVAGITRLG
ncbi:MAG: hydroxymethylbilane synthase, partial [Candidatus Omnitrophica bacterium]|nr:hydroxymethylbilane synthase [Candidatus Omnitrophota bacterium]